MTAPIINITSFTRSKISRALGLDKSTVTFQADQTLTDWEARAGGGGLGQGLIVGQAGSLLCGPAVYCSTSLYCQSTNILANSDIYFDVDDEELTGGDGVYQINIYGMNAGGEWTAYGS